MTKYQCKECKSVFEDKESMFEHVLECTVSVYDPDNVFGQIEQTLQQKYDQNLKLEYTPGEFGDPDYLKIVKSNGENYEVVWESNTFHLNQPMETTDQKIERVLSAVENIEMLLKRVKENTKPGYLKLKSKSIDRYYEFEYTFHLSGSPVTKLLHLNRNCTPYDEERFYREVRALVKENLEGVLEHSSIQGGEYILDGVNVDSWLKKMIGKKIRISFQDGNGKP